MQPVERLGERCSVICTESRYIFVYTCMQDPRLRTIYRQRKWRFPAPVRKIMALGYRVTLSLFTCTLAYDRLRCYVKCYVYVFSNSNWRIKISRKSHIFICYVKIHARSSLREDEYLNPCQQKCT